MPGTWVERRSRARPAAGSSDPGRSAAFGAARPRAGCAVSRFVDRGAIAAAWVGLGMAVTIGVSFLLVIPIEPVYWYLALPAGLLIGYYANARSERIGGPWRRVMMNALFAGLVTGLTYALFLLAVKALFFSIDGGYRDTSSGGPLECTTGADCVYQRYLAAGQGDAFAEAGITDVGSFSGFYWSQQLSTAGLTFLLSVGGALGGGFMYGITNRRKPEDGTAAPAT
jgi:hypothetical protein